MRHRGRRCPTRGGHRAPHRADVAAADRPGHRKDRPHPGSPCVCRGDGAVRRAPADIVPAKPIGAAYRRHPQRVLDAVRGGAVHSLKTTDLVLTETPMTAKQTFRIAAIPADGVGLEVVEAGRAVLDALAAASENRFAFEWQDFPWGSDFYAQHGKMMDEDGLEQAQGVRRHLLRRRRVADRPGPRQPLGPAPEDLPELRPVGQRPPGRVPPRHSEPAAQGRRHRPELGRGPRELRRRVRRPGRTQPVRRGDGRRCQSTLFTRGRLRAHHAVRVRPRPHPLSRRSPASPRATRSSTAWSCGTASSRRSPSTTPTSRPRASSSTPWPPSSSCTLRTSRSSWPPISTPTSSPTSAARPAVSASPPAPTSTRRSASRACSSPSRLRTRHRREGHLQPRRRHRRAALMLGTSACSTRPRRSRAIEDTTGNGIRTVDVGGNATTAEVTAAIIESLAN